MAQENEPHRHQVPGGLLGVVVTLVALGWLGSCLWTGVQLSASATDSINPRLSISGESQQGVMYSSTGFGFPPGHADRMDIAVPESPLAVAPDDSLKLSFRAPARDLAFLVYRVPMELRWEEARTFRGQIELRGASQSRFELVDRIEIEEAVHGLSYRLPGAPGRYVVAVRGDWSYLLVFGGKAQFYFSLCVECTSFLPEESSVGPRGCSWATSSWMLVSSFAAVLMGSAHHARALLGAERSDEVPDAEAYES